MEREGGKGFGWGVIDVGIWGGKNCTDNFINWKPDYPTDIKIRQNILMDLKIRRPIATKCNIDWPSLVDLAICWVTESS